MTKYRVRERLLWSAAGVCENFPLSNLVSKCPEFRKNWWNHDKKTAVDAATAAAGGGDHAGGCPESGKSRYDLWWLLCARPEMMFKLFENLSIHRLIYTRMVQIISKVWDFFSARRNWLPALGTSEFNNVLRNGEIVSNRPAQALRSYEYLFSSYDRSCPKGCCTIHGCFYCWGWLSFLCLSHLTLHLGVVRRSFWRWWKVRRKAHTSVISTSSIRPAVRCNITA